jgi:tetratricopeptide (TPR) repeat protein
MLLVPGANPDAAQGAFQSVRPGILVPFAFQRKVRPGPNFRKIQLEKWLDEVRIHRPGEVDVSARVVALLGPDALADVISAFEFGVVRFDNPSAKIDILKRAAVLHTDIATVSAGEGHPDEVNEATRASLHMGAALELVEALKRERQYPREDPFALGWWRAVAAVLIGHRETMSSIVFMQRAVSQFPADPDMLLMAGTLHELLASPLIQDDFEAEGELRTLRGSEGENLRIAEQLYREALKSNPGLLEARVRLGRVLSRQRRYELAIADLAAVPDQASEPKLQYYRNLFQGEAAEGLSRIDAAREAYHHALALYPNAQSATLALTRLERRAGDRSLALGAVLQLLRLPTGDEAHEDPWSVYFVATPARLAAEWLENLWAPLRRHP